MKNVCYVVIMLAVSFIHLTCAGLGRGKVPLLDMINLHYRQDINELLAENRDSYDFAKGILNGEEGHKIHYYVVVTKSGEELLLVRYAPHEDEKSGMVAFVTVISPRIETKEGIATGMTLAQVQSIIGSDFDFYPETHENVISYKKYGFSLILDSCEARIDDSLVLTADLLRRAKSDLCVKRIKLYRYRLEDLFLTEVDGAE